MKNEASASIRAPALLTTDQLRQVYTLAEHATAEEQAQESIFRSRLETSVKLRDSERYSVECLEDIFSIPNKKEIQSKD